MTRLWAAGHLSCSTQTMIRWGWVLPSHAMDTVGDQVLCGGGREVLPRGIWQKADFQRDTSALPDTSGTTVRGFRDAGHP